MVRPLCQQCSSGMTSNLAGLSPELGELPRPGAGSVLYFGSSRAGGRRQGDIHVA